MKPFTVIAIGCVISAGLFIGNQGRETRELDGHVSVSVDWKQEAPPTPAEVKLCKEVTPPDHIGPSGYWVPVFCRDTEPMNDAEWALVQREIIKTYKIEPELAKKWLAIPRARPPAVGEE